MSKVICYPRISKPRSFDNDTFYFEMFTSPEELLPNVGHVGIKILREIRKSQIHPSVLAFDFLMIALGVVSADRAVLRSKSADGWTRQIELTVCVHEYDKWVQESIQLEEMLRFLTGDFWKLNLQRLEHPICPEKRYELKNNDCVCLLSGGMDSLVGAIDLHEEGRNPLFVSQVVRGDAEHQRAYASAVGTDNLCQWSNSVKTKGESENSTRARSILFFAFALLASCGIDYNENGRKAVFVPENGFISLNIPLDPMRIGSLSTKTTHPVYMKKLQTIWDDLDLKVDLVLPYKFKTKGEVISECKNQMLMESLIFGSTSCGKYLRHGLRHCGVCLPCLVRRSSFIRAGINDTTENGYCIEAITKNSSQDVAAAAMACVQIQNKGIEQFVSSGVAFSDPAERDDYIGVVSRGFDEIRALLMEHGVL